MPNFIPVYVYAQKHGVKEQAVYRWLRERKFADDEIKKVKVEVQRIRIREDALPKLYVAQTK